MVNKIFKGLIRFLIEVIVMTVLIVGINIFTNGMYLWGLPRINDIQSVNITYPSVTDDVKEISSSEDIELALTFALTVSRMSIKSFSAAS